MIPIPIARTYQTTLRGRTSKFVQCEKCGFEYVYLLESTVTGAGTSSFFLDNDGARDRSAEHAAIALRQNLAEGCEVVPCPACGTVQQHMFSRARQRHLWWMWRAGLIALAAGGILALPATVYTLIDLAGTGITALTVIAICGVAVAWGVGMGLLILRVRLCQRYDPNDAPEEDRKRQGQQFAISKEDFLKVIGQV